jgi:hypothetical protein
VAIAPVRRCYSTPTPTESTNSCQITNTPSSPSVRAANVPSSCIGKKAAMVVWLPNDDLKRPTRREDDPDEAPNQASVPVGRGAHDRPRGSAGGLWRLRHYLVLSVGTWLPTTGRREGSVRSNYAAWDAISQKARGPCVRRRASAVKCSSGPGRHALTGCKPLT